MGDGRYYTYTQFFQVIGLTVLLVLGLVSLVLSIYRRKEIKGFKLIAIALLAVCLSVSLRIIEAVIPPLIIAKSLRVATLLLFLSINLFIGQYFVQMSLPSNKRIKRLINAIVASIEIAIVILTCLNNNNVLLGYDFFRPIYGKMYKVIIAGLAGSYSFIAFYIATIRRPVHLIYNNKTMASLIFIACALPMMGYLYQIYTNHVTIDFYEIGLYFVLWLVINIIVYTQTPFGLTTTIFNKVSDMVTDYIFVIDNNDNIIFKNQLVRDAVFLTDEEKISTIPNLFIGKVQQKQTDTHQPYFECIQDGQVYRFTVKQKQLKNQGAVIGKMITISEISSLMEMLHKSKDKQLSLQRANQQLTHYAEIVYHLEKEKAINQLLEEIVQSRDEQMNVLSEAIKTLRQEISEKDIEEKISETIHYNTTILNDVRKTVADYREHYQGKV